MMKKLTALLVILFLAFSLMPAGGAEEQAEKRILVFETTDLHGYILDASSGREDRFQYRLARIAALLGDARRSDRYDDVLLLDGGDLFEGPPVSGLTGGAVIRAAMDMMGYDAICLGNHEFDWDVTEYTADQDATLAPYVLGDYMGDPQIPVLASGLYDRATGERVPFTRDYTIVEKAGKRIAVVGYIPDFSGSIMRSMIEPYRIDGSLASLDRLIREIHQQERPDALIILAHHDPLEVAEQMDPMLVDLVCGGHTHQTVCTAASNGIPCIQGGSQGNGYASAALVFSADGGLRVEEWAYVSVTEEPAKLYDTRENASLLDEEVLAVSRAGWDAIREEMSEVLGQIDTPVIKLSRVGASSAGNWLTGLFLRATKDQGTVMAFYNNGGIRTSLDLPRGQTSRKITVYDIYTILPFGNSLLVYELNGRELARHLVNGLKNPNYGDQMTGLTFTYTADGNELTDRAERNYRILSITLPDGTPVDPDDTETIYRVCVSSYSASIPGSVFENKEPVVPEAEAPADNEAAIRVLREESKKNQGFIPVDTGERGVEIRQEEAPAASGIRTAVSGIQKYGNLTLEISASEFISKGYAMGSRITVALNGQTLEMPVVVDYQDVPRGCMGCRLDGKYDQVLLFINQGDLATALGIALKKEQEESPGYVWEYLVDEPVLVSITLTGE